MRVYALYLLLFQLAYRFGHTLDSFLALQSDAGERLAMYASVLGERRVRELSGPYDRRRSRFRWWFGGTAVLYVVVAAAIWVSGDRMATWLDAPIDKRPSAATPTSTAPHPIVPSPSPAQPPT